MNGRLVLLPVVAMLLATVALASVFVYYPLTITITPTAPGVKFQGGSNAGEADIGTNNIIVNIGPNSTSASVTIHPTYQRNYYKDVLRIYNGDDDAMNVHIIFDSLSNSLPKGSIVKMFFYEEDGTRVKELDITGPTLNYPIQIGQIGSGATWQIDFYVYIPEGTSIDGASYSASARLVYTPSTETPPVSPSSGRQ
ncbi:MAG: hypothetical protein QW335_06675 [Candidatus Nezhaarchaeales archaeon]